MSVWAYNACLRGQLSSALVRKGHHAIQSDFYGEDESPRPRRSVKVLILWSRISPPSKASAPSGLLGSLEHKDPAPSSAP